MIFFDNSASSYIKPEQVKSAMCDAMTNYSANPGRSGHNLAVASAQQVALSREKLAKFVCRRDSSHVIFTSGCTEALNLAIFGTARLGGHIVCTDNEHNSVLRPLEHLRSKGVINFSVAKTSNDGTIGAAEIEKQLKPNTYMIIVNAISNVNGDCADLKSIAELCQKKNILFCVDGAQLLGHKDVNFDSLGIDLLAVAGHKGLMGPMGVGALIVSDSVLLMPQKFGGTGTSSLNLSQPYDFPEGFESGTIATPNIIALGYAVDYVSEHKKEIYFRLEDLTSYLYDKLSKFDDIIIYSSKNNLTGVIAFNKQGLDSTDVADFLDANGVCVRAGLHCAPLKHIALTTQNEGAVRVSFSCFNTREEIDEFIRILSQI